MSVAIVLDDVKTTITSLGGAVAGAASEWAAEQLISVVGVQKASAGDAGIRFVVRATTAALAFEGIAYLMPETSSNIFFSILFFAACPNLIKDGVGLAQALIHTSAGTMNAMGAINSRSISLNTHASNLNTHTTNTNAGNMHYGSGPVHGGSTMHYGDGPVHGGSTMHYGSGPVHAAKHGCGLNGQPCGKPCCGK